MGKQAWVCPVPPALSITPTHGQDECQGAGMKGPWSVQGSLCHFSFWSCINQELHDI